MNKKINFLKQEQLVNQYKRFFKNHLINLSNRQKILSELGNLCNEVRKTEPKFMLSPDSDRIKLEVKIDSFLKCYFSEELIKLYNKELPKIQGKAKPVNIDNPFLLELLRSFSETFVQLNEKYKREWNYKTNFLNFLYDCIYHYGLHPNILKRNPDFHKKFDLIIFHNYRSDKSQIDFKIMMSYENFEKNFISQYIKMKPIKMGGKLIPFDTIHEVKITTTLLKEDEIELFALKNNFNWLENNKDYFSFINYSIDETEKYHPNPFDEVSNQNELNLMDVEYTKELLINFPEASELYSEALEKFNMGNYDRNVLDDLRLSLEELLRKILNNNKSLENQLKVIGEYQKSKGTTKEASNMLRTLLDYYTKFQNNNVKHRKVTVNRGEIKLFINLTTSFIIYLIKE